MVAILRYVLSVCRLRRQLFLCYDDNQGSIGLTRRFVLWFFEKPVGKPFRPEGKRLGEGGVSLQTVLVCIDDIVLVSDGRTKVS